jgi:hypothetical protein
VPAAKAGVGSAVNDATREVGGTLGVAVIGSIFTSIYANHLVTTAFRGLPTHVVSDAQNSVAAALATVVQAPSRAAQQALLDGVHTSFMTGFHIACIVSAAICLVGAFGASLLPGRSQLSTNAVHATEAELVSTDPELS